MDRHSRSMRHAVLQFLDEFVTPTVDEWRQDELSVRKAVIAISQIDIIADQFVVHQNPSLRQGDERNAEPELALRLIRDVHDTHKHGPLGRKNAKIRSGQRPQEARRDGAFQADAFQEDAFQVGTPALVIVEDDPLRR